MKKGNQLSDAKIQNFVWCYFPDSLTQSPAGNGQTIAGADLDEALEGPPLVHALLPKHSSTPLRLLSSKEIGCPLNGEMYSGRCVEYSVLKGEKWLMNY